MIIGAAVRDGATMPRACHVIELSDVMLNSGATRGFSGLFAATSYQPTYIYATADSPVKMAAKTRVKKTVVVVFNVRSLFGLNFYTAGHASLRHMASEKADPAEQYA